MAHWRADMDESRGPSPEPLPDNMEVALRQSIRVTESMLTTMEEMEEIEELDHNHLHGSKGFNEELDEIENEATNPHSH